MKRTLLKLVAAGAVAGAAMVAGAPVASASTWPPDVIGWEDAAYFSGSGSGSTFGEAVSNAWADAEAKAAAAGYGDCQLGSDVISVGIVPGDPPTYVGSVTLRCTR